MNRFPTVTGPALDSDPALLALVNALREKRNDRVAAVLLYGSCLRSGDLYDGLLDLYLLLDDYRGAYDRPIAALGNWLLPPNVFYAEQVSEGKTLRSKVTVISLQDFQRGCSRAWFQSYIWGRFAQPTFILYSRNESVRKAVEESLLEASHTLLHRCLPALPAQGTMAELWEKSLALSYTTELRTERSSRANELANYATPFYNAVSRHHGDSLAFPFAVYDDGDEVRYNAQVPPAKRRAAAFGWPLRRAQGKLLSVMRLMKALVTFDGALDYVAWKLERHSGEKIEIPEQVRRWPWIYIWGFSWKLYRRGIFK